MDEWWTRWDPIPAGANHYTALRVVQLTYRLHRDPLSLIVLSPWIAADGQQRDVAWRIAFQRPVWGFRHQPLGYWQGGTKPRWPKDVELDGYARNGPAMWAVTASSFLNECLQPHESRDGWYHYVIADFDESYEVIARTWEVEELTSTWNDLRDASS